MSGGPGGGAGDATVPNHSGTSRLTVPILSPHTTSHGSREMGSPIGCAARHDNDSHSGADHAAPPGAPPGRGTLRASELLHFGIWPLSEPPNLG